MIAKIIGRGVDAYFRKTFSRRAPPPSTEIYGERAERKLKTFVYPPEGDNKDAPVLALFYGGGWHHGNPWQLAAVARDLSRQGVEVYLPEYRVAAWDKVSVADGLKDVRQFYRWLIDRRGNGPLFFGGSSAGGFLAANIALTSDVKPLGMVLINPALNLQRERTRRFWPMLEQPRGFGVDDLLALDPVNNLSDDAPPTIILHGAHDPVIPIDWVISYVEEAQRRGGDCRLVPFSGYSHGFVNQALFPNAHARAIEAIIDFMTQTIKGTDTGVGHSAAQDLNTIVNT